VISYLPPRISDKWGQGHFQAPRGYGEHNGEDLLCYPSTIITSLTDGHVSKIGYPYSDDLSYRYVEVTNKNKRFRYFYVNPKISLNETVFKGTKIGVAQDITARYEGIGNHIHLEIIEDNTRYIDPKPYLRGQL